MSDPTPASKTPVTRRRFLRKTFRASAAVAVTGGGVYTWRFEPHWIDVRAVDMPLAHLPAALVGRTIVQFSDFHAGGQVDPDYLSHAIEVINSLEPDVVAFTGDLTTYRGRGEIETATRLLEKLRPGRLATVAVLGNHDYGKRWSEPDVGDATVAGLTSVGIRVLRNERLDVSGLTLVGLDDYLGTNWNPTAALSGLPDASPIVTLSHNPDTVDAPIWTGYRGWILSGHTHGGQVRLPFIGALRLPVQNRRYDMGHFDLTQGRHLYVNRGIGHLERVRFNCRPEITVFRLAAADTDLS